MRAAGGRETQVDIEGAASSRTRGCVLMLVENLSVPRDRRVWQEAVALDAAGFEVVVICPQGEARDTASREQIGGIEIHRYRARPAQSGALGYVREYVSAYREIRRLVRRLARGRRFDVVHAANPPDFLLLTALALRGRGARFVFDVHDLSPELYESRYGRRGLVHAALRAIERISFRVADVVIATNESYRRIAEARGGKPAADVFVVRNDPDLAQFDSVDADDALRHGKAHLLCYVGMMGRQDGLDHALRALAALHERRDDWHALFLGDGEALPEMRRLARELDLDDAVTFGGFVGQDDVRRALASADVCISPEPSSPLNDVSTLVKVGEYMAMGRPVVAFDLAETRATAGDAALYAEPSDPAALAANIDALLSDPVQRRELGRRGRQRIEQGLSWASSVRSLYAAYEHLLASRPVAFEQTPDTSRASAA